MRNQNHPWRMVFLFAVRPISVRTASSVWGSVRQGSRFLRQKGDRRPAIPDGADKRRGNMLVQLNGKRVELDDEVNTVRALLLSYQLQEKIVVVERNGEIVDRARYESTPVADGDRIEIVHFVGGG
jgi:sulfur carrier protein